MAERVEKCRLELSGRLASKIGPHQSLHFVVVNVAENPLQIRCSDDGESVSVMGPRDIKRRSGGALLIADHIVAVNCHLVANWLGSSRAEAAADVDREILRAQRAKRFHNQLVAVVAEIQTSVLVFGILRDSIDLMALSGDWTQIEIIHLPNDTQSGLGFGIVGGASTGVVIKTILPGSAADRDKRLRAGDRILQIGRINVQGMSSQQVASLLRQHDDTIELIVGRPIGAPVGEEAADSSPSLWTMGTKAALTPAVLEEHIQSHVAKFTTSVESPIVDHSTTATPTTLPMETQRPPSAERQTSSRTNSSRPSTDRPMSLKSLQEMALTTFCSENWVPGKFETIEVELDRDPTVGFGITVAGYVHKKEEITGVFVKSLVPNSSAHLSKRIRVHDLIVEVNGKQLERRRHADAVRTLVKSGPKAHLRMIRFSSDSPQSICLKMLHEQESATNVEDVQSNLIDYKSYWTNRLGGDFEIVIVDLKPDERLDEDSGLGLSLEGTVDIVDGSQLCPHHYIESLRKEGPAAKSGQLKAGDELLQVNETPLYSESHVTVRQELAKAAMSAVRSGRDVRLFLCRKAQQLNLFMPSLEQSLPLAYPLLAAANDDRLFKAKSEFSLVRNPSLEICRSISRRLRSRSLELFSGLAIWNCVPIVVALEKDSRGLGFSVIDYRDPNRNGESVIVIRSLVPGGVAQADGRIVPGDRLLFVNGEDLSSATLEKAVEALKSAPMGLVRIGIAKPIPVETSSGRQSPIITRSERLLAKGSSPRSRRRRLLHGSGSTLLSAASSQEEVWLGADVYRRLNPQLYFPSSGSATPTTPRSHSSMFSWTPCSSRSVSPVGSPISLKGSWSYDVVQLPSHLERSIKVMKGPLALGIIVDADVDKSMNGCLVRSVCSKKAVGRDGRIQVGDYIVRLNTENLRNVTNSQARAILRRTNLIGTQCNITYITAADARLWKQRFHREEPQSPIVNRLSPKVFPKFYKSPFLEKSGEMSPSEENRLTLEQLSVDCRKKIDELVEEFIKGILEGTARELSVHFRTPDWSSGNRTLQSPSIPQNFMDSKEEKQKEELIVDSMEPQTSKAADPIPQTSESLNNHSSEDSKTKRRNNFWGDARTVILNREPTETFGISIVGGRVEVSQKGGLPGTGNTVSGIFIKSVMGDSPAGRSNRMFMGDRVVSVNDTDLRHATHEQAVAAIKSAANPVRFVVQSLHSFSPEKFAQYSEENRKVEIIHESAASSTVTKPADSSISAPMELEIREKPLPPPIPPKPSTSADSLPLPESGSAAALEKSPDDTEEEDRFRYTKEKIRRKYGELPGEPTLIRLENIPPRGLGLSLAGKNENQKRSVFVVDIKSTSPLPLRIGDELLEINGKVLFGLGHQSASIKIRECCEGDQLALLILRPPTTKESSPKGEENGQNDLAPKLSLPADLQRNNRLGPVANHGPSSLHDVSQTAADNTRRKKSHQMERSIIETGKETLIEIDKDGKGLGLSIVGGSDTVLGSIVIHEVYSDGAAATDGRLKPGDQVLEVNGTSLVGLNHDQAISILRRTPAKVRLLVYRDVNLQLSLLDPTQIYNIHEVEIQKKPGRGLGISIVGRKDEPGVYISEIVKGGIAEADGRLLQGDQILQVNGNDVSGKMQEDVATLFKTLTGKIIIRVGRWKLNDAANKVHAAQPSSRSSQPSSAVASPQLNRSSKNTQEPTTNGIQSPQVEIVAEEERRIPSPAPQPVFGAELPKVTVEESRTLPNELSPVSEEPGSNADLKSLSEPSEIGLLAMDEEGSESHLIRLKKDDGHQWGMGIGKRPRGILITSLQPGSTAAEQLAVGDRIMAVNGVAITDQHSAVTLVKSSGNSVTLQIARPKRFA